MSRFRNVFTGSVVSVADEIDHQFTSGWEPVEADTPKPKTTGKKKTDN